MLECLREVRLEQFAGNLATRGVTDCTRLARLERAQFSTYGITTPTDVRRLTRLITVIRDLRAEGAICRHGAAAGKPSGLSRRANSDLCTPVQRCQQKPSQADGRRRPLDDAANSASKLPHRRPGRGVGQRPRRSAVKRGTSAQRDSVVAACAQYDVGPTSFVPVSLRSVSPLPTHVEKVRFAQSLLDCIV